MMPGKTIIRYSVSAIELSNIDDRQQLSKGVFMEPMNLPGPKARALVKRDSSVISPSYPRGYPLVVDHARGSEVWDVDGNRFLDFMAGIAVTSTGHAHPKVVKAIQEQAAQFIHISGDFYHAKMIE